MMLGCFSSKGPRNLVMIHGIIPEIPGNVNSESGCPCQETKTVSLLDLPAGQ